MPDFHRHPRLRSLSPKVRNRLQRSRGPRPRRLFLEQLEDRRLLAVDAQLVMDINLRPNSGGSEPNKFVDVNGTAFFSATTPTTGQELWKSDGTEAGTVLVKDVVSGRYSSYLTNLTNVNGTVFFTASDGVGGWELWKSDGTDVGTVFLKGYSNSYPFDLADVAGTLFFSANDGENGYELWKSDGTPGGTVMVRDLWDGPTSSYPENKTNVGGTLFFTANDGLRGGELWKSDGTAAGTVLVNDINPGPGGTTIDDLVSVNGTLFFTAGGELWTSDGTNSGTFLVSASAGSDCRYLTNVNGTLFFAAFDDNHGMELWKSDGTDTGTVLVKDLLPGSGSAYPSYLTNVNGTLFFGASGPDGFALWKSDGTETGTVVVRSIGVGSEIVNMNVLTELNGALVFVASSASTGSEIWKSDGTAIGTEPVRDINIGPNGSFPNYYELTNVNGTLFFGADDGVNGRELWKSDGTETGTVLVKDIVAGTLDSGPNELTNVNGTAFFAAYDGFTGTELWKSDGTDAGTELVKDIFAGGGSYPRYLTDANGMLFFQAFDNTRGRELWKSDGTESGTVLVKDIREGGNGSEPHELTEVGGTLYFTAFENLTGWELWRSDGSEAGTLVVKDIVVGTGGSFPFNLTNVDGTLFFVANDGVRGNELWKSDGTDTGTVLVKDIRSSAGPAHPSNLTAVNGTLFFTLDDGVSGYELWKSDGTEAGTVLVKDIFGGSGSSDPQYLVNVDEMLYFTAQDGVRGRELWKSDGTEAGTVVVSDIRAGAAGSYPVFLSALDDTVYFSANNGTVGFELWRSDGTAGGTELVMDIWNGTGNASPSNLINVNGVLYFVADDGNRGTELWSTDGTEAGTVLVADLANPGNSDPRNLINVNGKLFFAATTNQYGRELWTLVERLPTTPLIQLVSSSSTQAIGNKQSFASRSGVRSTSADGRFVAFASLASNLVAEDNNGSFDIFLKDNVSGTIARVSVASDGTEANGISADPSLNRDARYVAFESVASNLVPDDTNGFSDVFVKDLQTGVITRISTDASGNQANGHSSDPSVSGDGRYVAFESEASNLILGDTNDTSDIFVKDTFTGAITLASSSANGSPADGLSFSTSMSSDGRFVAFASRASNLVIGDVNERTDIFIKNLVTGDISRVSTDAFNNEANDDSRGPAVSADGRYVAFLSSASNLALGDDNGFADVFRKDTMTGVIELASVSTDGVPANDHSFDPSLSGDGRFVAYQSDASSLVTDDTNYARDVFVKDLVTGELVRVSTNDIGIEGNGYSYSPSLSEGGSYIVFSSDASNLVSFDENGLSDVFIGLNPLFMEDRSPMVTVNIVKTTLNSGDRNSLVTFEFSEDVIGFDLGDLTATEGTLSDFTAIDGNSFTAVFTANEDVRATGVVSVGTGYTDHTGNPGTSGSDSVPIDTRRLEAKFVKDINGGGVDSDLRFPTDVNGMLFFGANDGVHGWELWKSDGTQAGTSLVKDIFSGPDGSEPRYLANVNGTLFFHAYDGINGYSLWKSDGTEAGTVVVKASLVADNLTNVNGTLFFRANNSVSGYELWKSDGTEAGTVLVKDIVGGSGDSDPRLLTNVNGTLFFRANDGVHGWELWKSDGTEAGTVLVKDIFNGVGDSYPDLLTPFNGRLYFLADDGVSPYALWTSDGTEAGTVLVKDIRVDSANSFSFSGGLTTVNDSLYFSATDRLQGMEIWKSDGTEAGTVLVKDIRVGSLGAYPFGLADVNGTLFFRANDGIHGNELWRSDGTEAGTFLVKDITEGSNGSSINSLTNSDGALYFTLGNDVWQSSGTEAGTFMVGEIANPGNVNPTPDNLIDVNGKLFFTAKTEAYGRELYVLRPSESNSGAIEGVTWSDVNADGARDPSEPGLAGVTVYADLNNNSQLDGDEPFDVSQDDDPATVDVDETGRYRLADLPSGAYVLREITPDGFVKTFPETGLRATFDSGFGAEFQFSASPQSLNGLAYSSVSQELFALSSDKIKVFTRAGELLRLYSVNEAYDDLSVVPEAISLGGTHVPAGSLLASTRDSFFALSPIDGSVLASVTASLDENFSISYDPNSNEILTHNLYGSDAVQRFDPITGTLTSSVIATEIEFGDVEFLSTSGGFISAKTASYNGYTVVTEFDASGSIVRTLDLTATFGIRPLSSQNRGGITGLAYDEVNDTLFLAGTDGLIYSVDGLFAADSTKNAWTVQLDTSEVVEDIDFGNVPIIAPTDLHLSVNSIAENQAIGTVVGTFLTDDASLADHHRYLLVAGEHDSDNSRFTIDGNTLKAAEQFDFEYQSLYSVRVRSTDSLGQYVEKSIQIFVNNVNEPPTALILDDSHVFEEQPIGTSVGRLTAEDPETFDSFPFPGFSPFHFSLVDGVGDADNASFTVEGDTLKTNVVFDFETRTSYSIRVQVADPEGATYEQSFEITVDQIRGVPPLVDINSQPPGADSTPVNLVDVNGVLYFVANDGVHGNELWKSDGSASGTMLVKDIHPGAGSADLRYLTNVNGTLFFQADDGVHGQELWKSDGTVAGTVLVKDVNVGGAHGSPYNLTSADGRLFFTARNDSSGYELWRSDGTESGTDMIKDIHPGSNSSYPRYFTNVNGTIYFRADDGTHGFELWKSDGTAEGTTLVKDIVPGGDAGWVPQLHPVNVDGIVYFLADDGTQGTELWKSDGTPEGTVIVADVHPGPQSSFPSSLTGVNGALYFLADDGTRGRELWKTNGTSGGTELVSDIHPGANASFSFYAELVSVDDVLYFAATDGVAGYELWRSDGTTEGTELVADINPGGSDSSPNSLITAGDFLYFTADNGVGGFELWRSDGTTAGTQLLLDITEDSTSSFPYLLTRSGEHIFFAATTEIYGTELYTVPKSNPVLTWNAPNSITFGTLLSNTQLNATSNVAGTFAYSPAVGTKLSARADQQLSVTFTPTDTLNYNNTTASVLIDVLKANPIITWNAPSDIAFGTLLSNTQLNATSNVAGTFAYSPAVGTKLNAGADQQLNVTFTPTDTLNYNNAAASVTISVFRLFDFGDAPSALQSGFTSDYPVTLARNGARHSESSLLLGSLIDTETDGQASTSAGQNGVEGDDGSGLRDEDGVRFISTLVAQSSTASSSSVVVTASATGKIDAWIDFNRDGDWLDTGEQIFSSLQVQAGGNTLAFSIPPGASMGQTYARFRLSSTGGLAPTGAANDGEVEDYRVEILDGDAVSGVDVAIASGGADPLDLIVEGNQVIVRRGATELFRASRNSLNSIDVAGTDGDDTLEIADVSLIVDGLITGNLGTGNDVLRLMGSNQTLNLAQIVGANIQGLDAIDITGSGANSLTLDPDDVRAISVITKTFRVQHDNDDAVTYAGNWTAGFPEVIAGQFVHVLTLGDATVQVVNTVPFHNPLVALDADRDGHVSPLDALIIINDLNATGPHALLQPISVATLTNFYYVDINHDGAIAPIDVLVVINLLNARVGDAEPELAASSLLPYNAPPSIATMASLETRKGILSDTPMGFASRPPTPQVSGSRLSVAAVRQNVTTGTPSKSHRDDLIDTLDAFFAELGSVSD